MMCITDGIAQKILPHLKPTAHMSMYAYRSGRHQSRGMTICLLWGAGLSEDGGCRFVQSMNMGAIHEADNTHSASEKLAEKLQDRADILM